MKQAFSLVELSIVLVILGLLVGGVLAGQSLIRASELRSVSTDLQKITTAMHAFRDKYFAMPGDMSNATAFWGKDTTNCNGHTGSAGSPGTCNGNNDGMIGYATESLLAWPHLALAGLIEGNYTGVIGSGWTPGTNVLASKIPTGGYLLRQSSLPYSTTSGTLLLFAANRTGSTFDWPLLRPEEAWNMDQKLDDGRADSGRFYAYNGYVPPSDRCVTSGSYSTGPADYRLNQTSIDCLIYYRPL